MSSADIASIGATLEETLVESVVNLVFRQKRESRMGEAILQICPKEKTAALLEEFLKYGYDEGPTPSADFYVKEGQHLEFHFMGNIDFEYEPRYRCEFRKNIECTKLEFFIKPIDVEGNADWEFYHGQGSLYKLKTNEVGEYQREDRPQCTMSVKINKVCA